MSEAKPRGRPPKVPKDQVFALDREGWTQSEIARRFEVTPAAIGKILKSRDDAGHATLQPVAHDIELEPVQTLPRPVQHAPPPPAVIEAAKLPGGSEWRGQQLAQTLAERRRQLQVVAGADAAREFAKREAWHLTRAGVTLEAISLQLDVASDEVAALVAEARQAALEAIDRYDARISLSASLQDIEITRREALRTLNSASASPSMRASARRMLLQCAQQEADLAVLIEQYRAARGLGDGVQDTGAEFVSHWLPPVKTQGTPR